MSEHLKRAIAVVLVALIFVACVNFITWGSSPADWTVAQRSLAITSFILVIGLTASYPGYGD